MPRCVAGLFLISTGPALQRHLCPCSTADCCNYSCMLTDRHNAAAAYKIPFLGPYAHAVIKKKSRVNSPRIMLLKMKMPRKAVVVHPDINYMFLKKCFFFTVWAFYI